MEGHLSSSLEDFVVPEYQESSATFSAPDIWDGWSMTSPESPGKCFIMDHYDAMNHGFSGGLYCQIETGSVEDVKKLNVCGDLCGDSSLLGVKDDDHPQLHDFNEIEQMDDIFITRSGRFHEHGHSPFLHDLADSKLQPQEWESGWLMCSVGLDEMFVGCPRQSQDVPGNWSLHSSSELSLKPVEHVDVPCLSSSNENIDSSVYMDSHSAFDQSAMMSDGRDVPVFPFVPCKSGPCNGMPVKVKPPFTISGLYEVNRSNEYRGVEPSLEEVILQDLQRASGKLSDETRKCFYDTFYRLAKSSRQDQVSFSTNPEDRPLRAPCTRDCDQSDRTRTRRNCGTESETNSMDRAIANLTFNKMEFNIEMFPLPERGLSAVGALEGSSKRRTLNLSSKKLQEPTS